MLFILNQHYQYDSNSSIANKGHKFNPSVCSPKFTQPDLALCKSWGGRGSYGGSDGGWRGMVGLEEHNGVS